MRNTLIAAALILCVPAAAVAVPHTGKPSGPLNLYWDVAGTGWIANDGAAPFTFDGYTIESAGGFLPANVTGIFDNALADMVNFPPSVGLTMAEALSWVEMATLTTHYTEVTLGQAATLQPGDSFVLGSGFAATSIDDYTFTYIDTTSTGALSFESGYTHWDPGTGAAWNANLEPGTGVYIIPEPLTVLTTLLAVVCLGRYVRRRIRV